MNPDPPTGISPDRQGLRRGFTTGACAAGAAKAAIRLLKKRGRNLDSGADSYRDDAVLNTIKLTLPNGNPAEFALHRQELLDDGALCSIIKDGGDDPDCTHGAELVAEVRLRSLSRESPPEDSSVGSPESAKGISHVILKGGTGVAHVTKPGLGLEVGGPAINPVPRKNITEMVLEEWGDQPPALIEVTISVPDGEERAKKTLNARLGLIGGISILGTTGIVLPYSTSAFITSIVQAINLAVTHGVRELVFTTGGRSEAYAMKLLPHLPEQAFIQVGDYIGIGIKQCLRHGISELYIVGMMGKLSKMADGRMMTHASASEVNMLLLANLAEAGGASPSVVAEIAGANTARHVLEICTQHGFSDITTQLCRVAGEKCHAFAKGRVSIDVTMFDFSGTLLGRHKTLKT